MPDTKTNQPKKPRYTDVKATDYDAATPVLAGIDDRDRALLIKMHQQFDYAYDMWADIRADADEDMRYVAGDPWTAEDRQQRVGRPIVSVDQLNQYINQLVNTVRQNKRAIKVTPEGNGANDKTAELRANRIRQIEYLSHAQEAYTCAFDNVAQRSYGYARITADYESPRTQNQVLRIKAVPNPDQVLPDPDAESVCGADWKFLFYTKSMTKAEFKRDFPTATVQDFGLDLQAMSPRWIQQNRVQIAEWWVRRMVTRTCYEIQPGYSMVETLRAKVTGQQLPPKPPVVWIDGVDTTTKPKGDVLDTWQRDVPEVCMYLTNGIEILSKRQVGGKPVKKNVWKGPYIPFSAIYGKVLYLNDAGTGGKKVILSYIRLGRDGQKILNWVESTKLEVMAMQPRTPYMAYKGQLDAAQLALLQQSLHEPVAVIEANATSEMTGDTVLPLPRRELPDISSIQGYEIAAESAKRNIQNALGAYSASVGRHDTNVKSGVLQKQLNDQSDIGSFHFIDHYDSFIEFLGVQLCELLPYYDDTAKDVTVRKPDGSVSTVRINDPQSETPLYMDAQQMHAVTISTGPSYDSERQQANDLAQSLLSNPQAFPLVAGDAIRLMNVGPLGDTMAEDLDTLQPPALQAKKAAESGKGPNPAQMQAQIGQMKTQLDHAHQLLAQASDEIKSQTAKTQAEYAGKAQLAQADGARDVALQAMKDATSIAVAKINALAKGVISDNERELEEIALAHAGALASAQQSHDAAMQAMTQQHASEQQAAAQDHAATMQQTPPPLDPNAAPAAEAGA